MAASDNLQPKLFHGTTHWFKAGDIIEPKTDVFYPETPGAYATTSLDRAKGFARTRIEYDEFRDLSEDKQLELFAPVFPVEHISQHEDPDNKLTSQRSNSYRRDPKGFRVTGPPVDYVPRYYQHELR